MRFSKTTERHETRRRQRAVPVPLPQDDTDPRTIHGGNDPRADEHRMRSAGGPEDNATYSCSCGLVFRAPVSTGVQCPSCGTAQAW